MEGTTHLVAEDKSVRVQYTSTAIPETFLRTTQDLGCLKCCSSITNISTKACAALSWYVCKSFGGFMPLWLTFESSTWAPAWVLRRDQMHLYLLQKPWWSEVISEKVLSPERMCYPCYPFGFITPSSEHIFSSWMSLLLNLISFKVFVLYSCPS